MNRLPHGVRRWFRPDRLLYLLAFTAAITTILSISIYYAVQSAAEKSEEKSHYDSNSLMTESSTLNVTQDNKIKDDNKCEDCIFRSNRFNS